VRSNSARRWLSVLQYGVLASGMIGVSFALIIASGAHAGMRSELRRVVDAVGADRLRLQPDPGNRTGFTATDLEALAQLPYVNRAAADTAEFLLSHPRERYTLTYVGVTPDYFATRNIPLADGRSFVDGDTDVAILGQEIALALLGERAVGQVLDTGTKQYTVIGTLAYVPMHDPRSDGVINTAVFLPPDGFAERLGRSQASFDMIWIHVDGERISDAVADVTAMFAGRGSVEAMAEVYRLVVSRSSAVSRVLDVTAVLFLALTGSLILVIGGDIVQRNVRHNGLRRAFGASKGAVWIESFRWFGSFAALWAGTGGGLAVIAMPVLERLLGVPLALGPIHAAGAAVLIVYVAGAVTYLSHRSATVPPMRAIRASDRPGVLRIRLEHALVTFSLTLGLAGVLFLVTFSDYARFAWTETSGPTESGALSVRTTPYGGSPTFLPQYILSADDADAIASVDGVSGVVGQVRARCTTEGPASSMPTTVLTIYDAGNYEPPGELLAGRRLTQREIEDREAVALIAPTVADRLFERDDPIGQTLRVEGINFSVVGVFRPSVPSSRPPVSSDSAVLVPYGTIPGLVGEHILWVRLATFMDPVIAAARIAERLRERHPGHAPAVIENPLGRYGVFAAFLTRLVGGFMGLAVLALLTSIGGMFSVSWTRIMDSWHTLGVRRALGEPRWRTLLMAIRPAASLALAAGILGFALSILALRSMADTLAISLEIRPMWGLWTAFAILGAAILGGGIPALWAARLVPADTIRTGRQ